MTPRFVVAGSGRHGSGYIAAVLTAAGVRCGHEQWWNPYGDRVEDLVGDSSWCAVPFLDDYSGVVLHQVRDPLAVVGSLVKAPLWGPYRELVADLVDDDPVVCAVNVTVTLNERIERRAVRRWRLEDVDAQLVVDVGSLVGVRVDIATAARAVASVPSDFNWHGPGVDLGWADLPDLEATARLAAMASRYGYR